MSRINTQIYCADFETTTSAYSETESKVWLSYIENISNKEDNNLSYSIEEFFKFIESKPYNQKIYFHNLNFDGQFIIHYLSKSYNFVKSEHGKFSVKLFKSDFTLLIDGVSSLYRITLRTPKDKTIEFLCSYKILLSSVSTLAGEFEKERIDYDKIYDEKSIPQNVIDYIKKDVQSVIPYMKSFYDNYKQYIGITSSGTAMKLFKDHIGKYKYDEYFKDKIKAGKVSKNGEHIDGEWDYYKRFYLGGWNWIKKEIIRKECTNISVYDVNSIYPDVMRNSALPVGSKINCNKEECNHFKFIECYMSFKIKPLGVPFIPSHSGMEQHIKYLEEGDRVLLHITEEMLECIKRWYDITYFDIISTTHFKKEKELFKSYIDKFQDMKQKSNKGSFEYLFSKIMQNQLYGKFGMSYRRKKYYLREKTDNELPSTTVYGDRYVLDYEWDLSNPSYIPLAIAITSLAKIKTIDFANYANKLCQCIEPTGSNLYNDTDSCHLSICDKHKKELEENQNIDSKKLGYWDNEANKKYGYYIKRKLYFEYDEENEIFSEKMSNGTAGITKASLIGTEIQSIKKGEWKPMSLSRKKVNGGVILVDKEKKINDYNWD